MPVQPVIIATWRFGVAACATGSTTLSAGESALDAVEAAANVTEDDPDVGSVGYGGRPNADGVVELDAAIMDGRAHTAGAVGALTGIRRPVSVARRVMEGTPHVMLAGQNARRFAIAQGFVEDDLLTDASRLAWQQWRATQSAAAVAHFDAAATAIGSARAADADHDTIGICALDRDGNLAAACTTSGLAWKLPGRVGDSPLVGSGLYVDNAVGAAAATGQGDEILKACLSYRVVMLMDAGRDPRDACVEAVRYLLRKRPPERVGDYGAAVIALRKDGVAAAAATRSGHSAPGRLWQWAEARGEDVALHEGVYADLERITERL